MGNIQAQPAPSGGWPFLGPRSLRVLPAEPPGWERAGGLARTPNPAFFLLPYCPPLLCMMGKAILPLPLPLLLLPVWEGVRGGRAAAPHPSFLLICTHWPLQTRTIGAQPFPAQQGL